MALSPDLFVENFQIAGMNYQKYHNPLKINVSIYYLYIPNALIIFCLQVIATLVLQSFLLWTFWTIQSFLSNVLCGAETDGVLASPSWLQNTFFCPAWRLEWNYRNHTISSNLRTCIGGLKDWWAGNSHASSEWGYNFFSPCAMVSRLYQIAFEFEHP